MNTIDIFGKLDPEITERLTSRREALFGAGKLSALMALGAVPVALSGFAKKAYAQGTVSVTDVLNFALTLEYLEAEYYTIGVGTSGLIPTEDMSIFQTIQEHEVAHVEFLQGRLGDAAVAKPEFDFTAGGAFMPFSDYATFKLLAQAFEDTGVRAYKGQAPNLMSDGDVLQAALTIHSVEARHAARVRRLNGLEGWIPFAQPGVPAAAAAVYAGEDQTVQVGVNIPDIANVSAEIATEAFDEPLTMAEVLAIADPFIVN